MNAKILIFLVVIFSLISHNIFSQNLSAQQDSIKIEKKHEIVNDYLRLLDFYIPDMLRLNPVTFKLDDCKSITKFKMLTRLIFHASIKNEIIKDNILYQRQKSLILLTSQEQFKNQPNYDLGIFGRYLRLTKIYAALILAILSL